MLVKTLLSFSIGLVFLAPVFEPMVQRLRTKHGEMMNVATVVVIAVLLVMTFLFSDIPTEAFIYAHF